MEACLGDKNFDFLLIYLDDILLYSSTFEHLDPLNFVLSRLRQHGLKINPKKCHFVKAEVNYLGHGISSQGIDTDPDKYIKRLLLRCIHHFNSDLIYNMDHMRISGTELSSVILSQTKYL